MRAPIDPDQLLKALDSLLSKNGGIKSVEDVPRLASIMNGHLKLLQCVWSCFLVVFVAINISDFFTAIA
ncbi:hypothetical protein AVEN_95631-1 [Araneus ventricosus]|uniref:Uncharacterized protein n=1 Tax=Araneus ventricosus TaxID=182803 RepID=A0A4Y2QVM2_ARAVE|nr:hypothetical protein AVEN_95631-1 [Araneus ventricosus]